MSEITFERGDAGEVFGEGRGYQAPAHDHGLPPLWGSDVPDFRPRDIPAPPVVSGGQAQPPDLTDMKEVTALESLIAQHLPTEWVDLVHHKALFEGYELALDDEAMDSIRRTLVSAVVRRLDEEKARVQSMLLKPGVRPSPNAGLSDLSVVPRTPGTVGEAEPGGEPEVFRVRESTGNPELDHVLGLPGTEDVQTPPGANS